jgi:hypothetical protein
MNRQNIVIFTILVVFQFCSSLWAAPTTADEAEKIVTGWLKGNSHPLGINIGQRVKKVETFTNNVNEPVYYIVYLEPAGFVIVSADDLVEPIIGFTDEGTYDPSQENPLWALVTNDLNRRIEGARSSVGLFSTSTGSAVTDNQKKWNFLKSLATGAGNGLRLMALDTISDIRVAPLIETGWGQWYVCEVNCFNYYTPYNYPCGCVATAMAQLMNYHQYPSEPNDYDPNEPDGKRKFWISVITEGEPQIDQRFLRGGDGFGGPYRWDQMVNWPDCYITLEQRQAMGALCYDAGISTGMVYSDAGSGAYSWLIPEALQEAFNYSNAVNSMSEDSNDVFEIEGEALENMVNTNLDAGNPVILGISDTADIGGHAVICDGYGYDDSTLYHHLNLGYVFLPYDCRRVWYDLPDVSDECSWHDEYYIYRLRYYYNNVIECVYNIFTHETGEIVSGRVFDSHGRPIEDALVIARSSAGGELCTSTSNNKGIYALKGLDSNATYNITVDKIGYDFELNEMTTGLSVNGSPVSGNKWGVNLTGYSNCEVVTIGTGEIQWEYPLRAYYEDCRTQVIYLASEIGRSGYINELELYIVEAFYQEIENWTIRMKHTGLSEYETNACLLEAEGWTVVHQDDRWPTGGGSSLNRWVKFEFQTPFEYNGVDNLMVDFSFNNSSYSQDCLFKASHPGGKRSVYAYSDSRNGDPLDWPATDPPTMRCSSYVPNIKLSICEESTVIY